MNPRLKRFVKIGAIFLGLALITAVLVAYLNEDRIRNLAIGQLNELLDTEVSVQEIEFSLLKKFPKASIEFKNITIQEKSNLKEKQNLIEARSIFLEFDPFDLITGTYIIDRIEVIEGLVRVTYFKDGTENFRFFKSSEGSEEFKISLTGVRFKNSKLIYRNFRSGDKIDSDLEHFNLTGDIGSEQFELVISSSGKINALEIGSFKIKKPYIFDLSLALGVDSESEKYTFNKARISLGKVSFKLDGFMQNLTDGMDMALTFTGEDTRLNDLKEFFPASWADKLEEFDASGTVEVKGILVGKSTTNDNPAIDLTLKLEEGALKHAKSGMKFENLYLSGRFSNGNAHANRTSFIEIDSVYFSGKTGNTYGSMKIQNLDDINLRLKLNSAFELASLKELIGNDSIEVLNGQCLLSVSINSALDSLTSIKARDIKTAEISGSAKLKDVFFKYTGMPKVIEKINGQLNFRSNSISVDSLTLLIADNQIDLKGQLYNLIPYLFYADEQLSVRGMVSSPSLDIDEMLAEGSNSGTSLGLPISKNLDLQLHIKTGEFVFRKFQATQLNMDLHSSFPNLDLEHLSFNAMEGTYNGWISMELKDDRQFYLKSELKLQHVNVQDLFAQFENFGQKAIVAENLKGYANISLAYESFFDENFKLLSPSVKARSSIEILNGQLIDYEPMLALSKYIEIEELKNIKFSRLYNEVEISNEVVIIPQMDIKSSALELSLSGRHSFSNEIEYHFQLYLNDFLFKKAKSSKKNQTEFGEIEADEDGRAKLYIRMTGTVDDYKIKLDRKALREKWSDDLNEERNELKELFRQEFKKEERKEKIEPLNFEIEWEGQKEVKEEVKNEEEKKEEVKKEEKKKGLLDKMGGENKDEYETYDPDKYD